MLLLAVPILALLDGCGGQDTSSDGGETTSAETVRETAPDGTGSGRTTSANAKEGAVPASVLGLTIALTPNGDSGVNGTAVLTDTTGGIEAILNVRNLYDQPDAEHPAHIHAGGTCAEDRVGNGAGVLYPLDPVVTGQNGDGSSTTEIPGVTVAELFSGAPKYVDVHLSTTADQASPSASCADIYTRTGGD